MPKFDGILFCTDLDGTLLRDDKSISKENLDAMEYFKSEGGAFTFVTGRMPSCVPDICAVIKPNIPYGCINGAGIFDHSIGQYLWTVFLSDEVLELVKYVDENLPAMGIQLNTKDHIYFNKDSSAMALFRAVTKMPNITCHYMDVKDKLLKVVFGHEDENQIDQLMELLNSHPKADRFDFIRSERTLYEILPKGVSKGLVLEKMVELLNMDRNRTIAVGDYNNDISMIRAAKIGFAVENARPEVKAAADRITVSNHEHAIARIVEELDNGIIRF